MIEFKNLPGFEGRYLAASDGLVYSLRKKKSKPSPFPLYCSLDQDGYWHTKLQVNKKITYHKIHALICRAFHGEKPNSEAQIRHLDGNKDNNRPENLKWGTKLENEADKRDHGTALFGSKVASAKLNEMQVREIREHYKGKTKNVVELAAMYGVSSRTIYHLLNGRNWNRT